MDNNKKLAEEMLKADGINPTRATEIERAVFNKLLNQHLQKRNYIFSAYKNLIRFAAVLAIVASLIWMLSTFQVKQQNNEKTPTGLMTIASLRLAMQEGGVEAMEKRVSQASKMFKPISNNEFLNERHRYENDF